MRAIQATASAFAAILADGLVVTWGDDATGGDSASVGRQLHDIQQIQVHLLPLPEMEALSLGAANTLEEIVQR